MTAQSVGVEEQLFVAHLDIQKLPAHWLMAHLGKRVLRPGGRETTRWLLDKVRIQPCDDVVEFAPGVGLTACEILRRKPKSYAGVERNVRAVALTRRSLAREGFLAIPMLRGDAADVPLPNGAASLVFGEAMLSMQSHEKKLLIMSEAHRLLRPGGRYAVHELAVIPETIDKALLAEIHRALSATIHVGVRIGTPSQWEGWLESAGFRVEATATAPMRLLELDRLLEDEGIAGTTRFVLNAIRTPGALQRLRTVRACFRRYRAHLGAIAVVASTAT